jgi:ATP-dependent DNA ligase
VLVRRDGAVVRVYSRNAVNWTDQFSTIAAVAATLEAHSFTISVPVEVGLGFCRR